MYLRGVWSDERARVRDEAREAAESRLRTRSADDDIVWSRNDSTPAAQSRPRFYLLNAPLQPYIIRLARM